MGLTIPSLTSDALVLAAVLKLGAIPCFAEGETYTLFFASGFSISVLLTRFHSGKLRLRLCVFAFEPV